MERELVELSKHSVSVVIPVFNGSSTLRTCIESVLNQSHPPVEILICDDGSTDQSEEIVTDIKDPRIRWCHTSRRYGTPAAPRNRGVSIAAGKWVAFLDCDDRWDRDHLLSCITTLTAVGARAIATNAWRIRDLDSSLSQQRYFSRMPSEINLLKLAMRNWVITSSAVISKDILLEAGPAPELLGSAIYEDYALWLRVATLTKIHLIGEPTVYYSDIAAPSFRDAYAGEEINLSNTRQDFVEWSRERNGTGLLVVSRFLLWLRATLAHHRHS